MDLSRIKNVYFLVWVVVFLLGKVLPCELPLSGKISRCGDRVPSKERCPKTCCFDTSKHPNCYFQKNAYGPVQHSNGLCINVKDGSHQDSNPLIWSRDCTSRNAFVLVSYDHPLFHIASGKCVLPATGSLSNPRGRYLVLKSDKNACNAGTVTYRTTENGNLEYYYRGRRYKLCIGSKSDGGPKENDRVSIPKKACEGAKCQDALSYVYQRRFAEGKNAALSCEPTCSTIEVIWANFGVQLAGRYPLAISSSYKNCVTTTATNVMQRRCNGKTQCSFVVQVADFLQSNCLHNTVLLVRYTCKGKTPGFVERPTTESGGGGGPLDEKQDDDNSERASTASNKWDGGTAWYLYIVLLSSGVIMIILLCVVVFGCRRLRNRKPAKSQANPEPQTPEDNSVYESLDLTEMNCGDDNYQSLQVNSGSNEVLYENADRTYTELNTIGEDENYHDNLR